MKRQQSQSILGLTLDGGVLTAVEMKRTNGSVKVLRQTKGPLTLNPLRDEPELAGREIRNLLNQAQISVKRCVAGVPAHWALTVHTKIPAMEEADVASFLELEAERGFACNTDELQISSRIFEGENGERYASIIGIPRAYLERFEAVLLAAQLKPASLSLGIAALPDALSGAVTVEIADSRLDVLIGSSAGVAALRALESAFDTEGVERRVQAEVLARELRITLGQLSEEIRQSVHRLNIFGEERFATQLRSDFETRARVFGLESRHVTSYSGKHHGLTVPENAVSGAFSLVTEFLSGAEDRFEFLPPKPTFWQEIGAKYSSRRLAYAGAAAALLLLGVLGVFGYQQAQFSKYETQWAGMRSKVAELEDVQSNVRRFRAWQDMTPVTLNIMRRLTEAFPEDGVVAAKIVEIRNGNQISCMGTAKDNSALLKTIDRLRNTEQVRDLRVDQIRGNAPLQFTFNFQWSEVVTREN